MSVLTEDRREGGCGGRGEQYCCYMGNFVCLLSFPRVLVVAVCCFYVA